MEAGVKERIRELDHANAWGCSSYRRRLVHIASQDFTVVGGSAGGVHGNKIAGTLNCSLKGRARRSSSSTIPAAPA
jgi:acetyl-CoA carboxylase beta subunit